MGLKMKWSKVVLCEVLALVALACFLLIDTTKQDKVGFDESFQAIHDDMLPILADFNTTGTTGPPAFLSANPTTWSCDVLFTATISFKQQRQVAGPFAVVFSLGGLSNTVSQNTYKDRWQENLVGDNYTWTITTPMAPFGLARGKDYSMTIQYSFKDASTFTSGQFTVPITLNSDVCATLVIFGFTVTLDKPGKYKARYAVIVLTLAVNNLEELDFAEGDNELQAPFGVDITILSITLRKIGRKMRCWGFGRLRWSMFLVEGGPNCEADFRELAFIRIDVLRVQGTFVLRGTNNTQIDQLNLEGTDSCSVDGNVTVSNMAVTAATTVLLIGGRPRFHAFSLTQALTFTVYSGIILGEGTGTGSLFGEVVEGAVFNFLPSRKIINKLLFRKKSSHHRMRQLAVSAVQPACGSNFAGGISVTAGVELQVQTSGCGSTGGPTASSLTVDSATVAFLAVDPTSVPFVITTAPTVTSSTMRIECSGSPGTVSLLSYPASSTGSCALGFTTTTIGCPSSFGVSTSSSGGTCTVVGTSGSATSSSSSTSSSTSTVQVPTASSSSSSSNSGLYGLLALIAIPVLLVIGLVVCWYMSQNRTQNPPRDLAGAFDEEENAKPYNAPYGATPHSTPHWG